MCTHKSFSTTVFVAVVSRDASVIFAADYIFKPQHQTLMLELTCEDERSCSRAALLRIGRAAPHSPRVCPRRAEARVPEEERTRTGALLQPQTGTLRLRADNRGGAPGLDRGRERWGARSCCLSPVPTAVSRPVTHQRGTGIHIGGSDQQSRRAENSNK